MTKMNLAALALTMGLLTPHTASAHAFLDHAVPGVGSTAPSAPAELQLTFTEEVETSLSGVRVTTAAGAAVPAAKATGDGSHGSTLHVRLTHALSAGTYVVHWHVVSVDTHPTSGTYKFTISP